MSKKAPTLLEQVGASVRRMSVNQYGTSIIHEGGARFLLPAHPYASSRFYIPARNFFRYSLSADANAPAVSARQAALCQLRVACLSPDDAFRPTARRDVGSFFGTKPMQANAEAKPWCSANDGRKLYNRTIEATDPFPAGFDLVKEQEDAVTSAEYLVIERQNQWWVMLGGFRRDPM